MKTTVAELQAFSRALAGYRRLLLQAECALTLKTRENLVVILNDYEAYVMRMQDEWARRGWSA